MNESNFLRRIHKNPDDEVARRDYREWLTTQESPRAIYMELMARRKHVEVTLAQLDAELAELVPEVGPHWITALYPQPGKNPFIGGYTLDDGREVQIKFMRQSLTYSGLIEGVPNDNMNRRLIDRLVKDERERGRGRGDGVGDPYLVPPEIQQIDLERDTPYPFGKPESLPAVTCVARFESSEPVRDRAKDYSELSVIWFQEDLAFPIAPPVLANILGLDWASLAIDLEI